MIVYQAVVEATVAEQQTVVASQIVAEALARLQKENAFPRVDVLADDFVAVRHRVIRHSFRFQAWIDS